MPITADKGLCGATNSSVTRPLRNYTPNLDDFHCVFVGDRTKASLSKSLGHKTSVAITGVSKKVPVPAGFGAIIARETMIQEYDTIIYIWNYFNVSAGTCIILTYH